MPIPLHYVRSHTFHGTKRRIFHLLEEMGTSGDQIWPFASQPFMRSPGPLTPDATEEWHLGIHAILAEVSPEESIVWRFLNDGVDGTHGFYLTAAGKETTLEHRIDANLSETEGRLLWRRIEDQHERSIEALFEKLTRVLKR
jgi:hypothetical protein